jgi:hypothetical protein
MIGVKTKLQPQKQLPSFWLGGTANPHPCLFGFHSIFFSRDSWLKVFFIRRIRGAFRALTNQNAYLCGQRTK